MKQNPWQWHQYTRLLITSFERHHTTQFYLVPILAIHPYALLTSKALNRSLQ